MFNVYNQHQGSNTALPTERSVGSVKKLAEAAAKLGHNAFYRVFKQTSGVTGERFETAFSVLGGTVTEHPDVSFPAAHF